MLKTNHLSGGLFFLNQGEKLKPIVNVNWLETDEGKRMAHAYSEMRGGL